MLKLTESTPPMLQPGATSTTSWLPSGYVTVALAETTCSQFSTQSSEILEVSPSELQLVPNSGSPAALAAAWMLTPGVSVGIMAAVGLAGSLAAVAVAGWSGAGVAGADGSAVAMAGGCSGSAVAVSGGFSGSAVAGAGYAASVGAG
jgi:hypothetical protein